MKYLLHRRITVDEPHKRKRPVQCMNCQEFEHTKSYCKLRLFCVACGDLHSSSQCEAAKQGLEKKCGNCGSNHSANYRGYPVYKDLLKRLKDKQIAKSAPQVFTMHNEYFTKINNVKNNEKSSVSYADTLKSSGVLLIPVKTRSGSKHVFKY